MRIQSARASVERSRPLSAKKNQHQKRAEFLQRVYYDIPDLLDRPGSARIKSKISSLYTPAKNTKSKEINKQKQALVQQNILLKKKVNMLEMQVSQLNGKMIVTKSKNSKIKKILDIEFQNQTLWSGKGTYLVTGVKNQYEKLQVQYKEKCEQLEKTKQKVKYTNLQQLQKQIQRLQITCKSQMNENLSLNRKIDALEKAPLTGNALSQRNYQIANQRIEQLQDELNHTIEQLGQNQRTISQLYTKFERQRRLAEFNKKLATQKDNEVHSLYIQNKRLQKKRQSDANEIQSLKQKIVQIQIENDYKLTSAIAQQQRKAHQQRQIYTNIIQQSSTRISQLQKQVAYLTTLASYWKPLDNQRQPTQSPIKKINIVQVQKRVDEEKSRKIMGLNEGLAMLSRVLSKGQTEGVVKEKQEGEVVVEGKREQKRADVRREGEARRVRPIGLKQVQDIGQLLRFRLITKRIPLTTTRTYFSPHPSQPQPTTNQQHPQSTLPFQALYITMRQTHNILLNQPFCLSQSQSQLLSRYLIEDVQNDWIYCQWDNENKREVVKSIFKNVVKDYEVVGSVEEMEQQAQGQLEKYRQRISAKLQQSYKDGYISKSNLVGIMEHQLSQPVIEFIIGKLAIQAQSLNKLNYTLIF